MAAAALWYLRARFDSRIDVHKFRLPERPDGPLWNADPAVITARVRARSAADLLLLVSDSIRPATHAG